MRKQKRLLTIHGLGIIMARDGEGRTTWSHHGFSELTFSCLCSNQQLPVEHMTRKKPQYGETTRGSITIYREKVITSSARCFNIDNRKRSIAHWLKKLMYRNDTYQNRFPGPNARFPGYHLSQFGEARNRHIRATNGTLNSIR